MSQRSIIIGTGLLLLMVAVTAPPATAQSDPYQDDVASRHVKELEQARAIRKNGQADQAIERLERLVQAQPNYYRARYNLALAYAEKQDYEKAEKAFTDALKVKHEQGISDASFYNSFGWFYMLKGDLDHAERLFLAALYSKENASAASREKTLNNIGVLYIHQGDLEAAARYLQRAINEFDSKLARENLALSRKLQEQQQL